MSHFNFDVSLTSVDHARVRVLAAVAGVVGAIYESHALFEVLIRVVDSHQLLGLVRKLKVALASELIVVRVRLLQNLKWNRWSCT